ncbi:hypothetical protein Tco_0467248, partial [Tanacetum coccineum]
LEDHVPVYISEPEHPEDLVPAEDEAPVEPYITEVASAPTPPLPIWGCYRLVSRAKVIENQVKCFCWTITIFQTVHS